MDIKIFTTGGTIDKVYFDAKSDYEVGDPQILVIFQEANVQLEHEIEPLFRKDSLEITDADRAFVAERVRATPCRRILITHGTDTMADTARSLMDIGDKVIVLVGSLTPARFKRSDAEFNIGFALGALSALSEGVYIAMNGRIFEADKVQKNREANRFESV